MHMDDLWFDVAIRGERDLEEDLIVRLHLSDGAEPAPKGGAAEEPPPAETRAKIHPAPAVDLY